MPTKLRKTRKMRGSFTCGYGAKKKHRGKGSKGGKGYAGSHKHHWNYMVKYEPDHFGKHGFFSRKKKGDAINVGDLEKLSDKNDINLSELGYDKLLGKGSVSRALVVTVASFSKQAKEKIEKAGGKIIGAEESGEEWEEAAEKPEPKGKKKEEKIEDEEAIEEDNADEEETDSEENEESDA